MKFTGVRRRIAVIAAVSVAALLFAACSMNAPAVISGAAAKAAAAAASGVNLGTAASFAVLGATTVTSAGTSVITGDLGVSPGTAITGFQPSPINTISGPGTVTAGLGTVSGTIYAAGPVAGQAHNDAVIAYNYLVAQTATTVFSGVTQLDGMTLTPGVYSFAPSANLQVNGNLYLDFQGNADAVFIFQLGTTLVTMAGSNVIAVNNPSTTCVGSNVYWAVGSSATIDGSSFIGTVIANISITMTSAANIPPSTIVAGRMIALNGEVTMVSATIAACAGTSGGGTTPPPKKCPDFVTGGGWIDGDSDSGGHNKWNKKDKATFGVSGGIKNGDFWGQLSYKDHGRDGVKVKSTGVTAYIVIDAKTRQIEGTARINGRTIGTYKVIVVDNGERGRNDTFSIELSNGYSASGTLKGGNIQLHNDCGKSGKHDGKWKDRNDRDDRDGNHWDRDEQDGNANCDR